MSEGTVTYPVIKIQIERRGHFYYYSRWCDGKQEVKNTKINRETADTVIRAQNQGTIPAGVNLDVVKPRSWVWSKEIIDS